MANENKTLNKPFRLPQGSAKKFGVYVKNDKGNVVIVKFGDPNMSIKRDDPERRSNYRARHNCDNPGPKYKANYWSCKMWSAKPVSQIVGSGEDYFDFDNLPSQEEIISFDPDLINAKEEWFDLEDNLIELDIIVIILAQDGKQDIGHVELGNNMSVIIERIVRKNLRQYINESEINPSDSAVKNICDSEKFCSAQGKITFGQLKALVESGSRKRIFKHVGEGGYKATLRLLPWFIPQLAFAGFTGSIIRAVNKILRPTLQETTNYKTWWGKVIMRSFDLAEGELNLKDPLTSIFFISDGLLTLMDDKYKIRFARYIAELASEMPDDQEVPEFFVENELRHWLNEKFLLDPPLQPKNFN